MSRWQGTPDTLGPAAPDTWAPRADVELFPGHISCDSRARSEIVVPVFDTDGSLLAVLDVDSEHLATFDGEHAVGLERLVDWFRRQ